MLRGIRRQLLLHVRVLVGSGQARVEHLDVILDRVGCEVLSGTSGSRGAMLPSRRVQHAPGTIPLIVQVLLLMAQM